jgi:phosphopantetheinyl transferase
LWSRARAFAKATGRELALHSRSRPVAFASVHAREHPQALPQAVGADDTVGQQLVVVVTVARKAHSQG